MVLRNGEKYSCASCIKGHRSSSCQHLDRPLIAVKRKGRPVTQCAHCRELRKTKKLHIKCICAEKAIRANAKIACGHSGRASSSSKVQNLLNPCDCSESSHCQCCELLCEAPSTRYCRPKQVPVIDVLVQVSELALPEPIRARERSILPSPVYEEKGAFCACGCRSTSAVFVNSPLAIKNLLNPCKCCMDGKKCGCNHLKKRSGSPAPPSNPEFAAAATCCSNPPASNIVQPSPQEIPSCCSNPPPAIPEDVVLDSWHQEKVSLLQAETCCPPRPPQHASTLLSDRPKKGCCQPAPPSSTPDMLPNQQPSSCCSSSGKACTSCAAGCKCRERSINTGLMPSRKEFIDQDGIRNCGCGCFLSSVECTDCIQDACTEFLFRPSDI